MGQRGSGDGAGRDSGAHFFYERVENCVFEFRFVCVSHRCLFRSSDYADEIYRMSTRKRVCVGRGSFLYDFILEGWFGSISTSLILSLLFCVLDVCTR